MTFLLRAARSGPVRPFVKSELDCKPCWLFAVVIVVILSSSVSGSVNSAVSDGNPGKDG